MKSNLQKRSIEEYLRLPYTIEVVRGDDEDEGWAASVAELPGCITAADSFEELEAMVEDAMRLWITTAIEDGLPIPEPRDVDSYSGKFIVRVPKWLHKKVAEQAEREGISLNQFVSTALASTVGSPEHTPQVSREDIQNWVAEAVQQSVRNLIPKPVETTEQVEKVQKRPIVLKVREARSSEDIFTRTGKLTETAIRTELDSIFLKEYRN